MQPRPIAETNNPCLPNWRCSIFFSLNFSEDFFSELQAVTPPEAVVILKRLVSPVKDLLLNFVIVLVEKSLGYSSRKYFCK
jgi:hypothetical protein